MVNADRLLAEVARLTRLQLPSSEDLEGGLKVKFEALEEVFMIFDKEVFKISGDFSGPELGNGWHTPPLTQSIIMLGFDHLGIIIIERLVNLKVMGWCSKMDGGLVDDFLSVISKNFPS